MHHFAPQLQLGRFFNNNWLGWSGWMTSTFGFVASHVDPNKSLCMPKFIAMLT